MFASPELTAPEVAPTQPVDAVPVAAAPVAPVTQAIHDSSDTSRDERVRTQITILTFPQRLPERYNGRVTNLEKSFFLGFS